MVLIVLEESTRLPRVVSGRFVFGWIGRGSSFPVSLSFFWMRFCFHRGHMVAFFQSKFVCFLAWLPAFWKLIIERRSARSLVLALGCVLASGGALGSLMTLGAGVVARGIARHAGRQLDVLGDMLGTSRKLGRRR